MTQWEHFIHEHRSSVTGDEANEVHRELLRIFKLYLDKLGCDGWEMVTVTFETDITGFRADPSQVEHDYYSGVLVARIVAKRPLGGQPYR